ncbi:DNA-binding response regulator [Halarcobacter ebronensis]|uniref:DNA-binding response regulator n=1 Tax=Halarcobacter ebronensis TaxID=1462615 RepID=A0A4Q0YEY7_9BACT|nr:response regulator transcription factor [Halarcobacter ebronensis]RXJ68214.1 DNA-binding response regulator [Halarcobacter ebronensis]RXK04650.1 DNA-binding response regulator [Halarcobacter ebronensis]
MKILLLEDDYVYNESIKEYLEDLGFQVDSFYDGESALDSIIDNNYYLAILDIKVPKLNGHEVIKYLKDIGDKTPIIITTSLTDIDNITIGYQLGCKDYLKKPFELKELELRINSLLDSHYEIDKENICNLKNDYTFNIISGLLKYKDEVIDLTSKEKDLILFLIKNANCFCEIENIRENVWEGKEIHHADIRMYIRKIRLKTHKDFIISLRGVGYKIEVTK